jgi:hypothetical protein
LPAARNGFDVDTVLEGVEVSVAGMEAWWPIFGMVPGGDTEFRLELHGGFIAELQFLENQITPRQFQDRNLFAGGEFILDSVTCRTAGLGWSKFVGLFITGNSRVARDPVDSGDRSTGFKTAE